MNPQDDINKIIDSGTGFLGYFDQQVLASYRNDPHKYELETDSFEGTLTVTRAYYREMEESDNTDDWLSFKFGYRALVDGNLAVVLWLPDLEKAPSHQARWVGFLLREPQWATEDERFRLWALRYLGGSWDVDNGPKFYLSETIMTINALTQETVGLDLYKHRIDSSLAYPAGENTHRYQDAHAKLYGFLIDGLDKPCIQAIAERLGISIRLGSDRTVAAMQRVFPTLAAPSNFNTAMSLVSEQRRIANHSVRLPAQRMEAFTTFTHDLSLCLAGLHEVLDRLEKALNFSGESARKTHEARERLPRITETQHSFASIHAVTHMEGKTIERITYGDREPIEGVHLSEAFIVHFTDGSIMAFDTGSNAGNIASSHEDVAAEDFHVSFHLTWVPPIEPQS